METGGSQIGTYGDRCDWTFERICPYFFTLLRRRRRPRKAKQTLGHERNHFALSPDATEKELVLLLRVENSKGSGSTTSIGDKSGRGEKNTLN